jgi:hypothetical protein
VNLHGLPATESRLPTVSPAPRPSDVLWYLYYQSDLVVRSLGAFDLRLSGDRKGAAEARGRTRLAQEYYQQFLRRYDRPVASQAHVVEEAEAALARLRQNENGPAESIP